MDVHIGELSSQVTAVDTESLLTPQLLERIARATADLLTEQQRRDEASERERRLRTSLDTSPWLDGNGDGRR